MPRVPKKNPRSGSVLLGQELRRLRGMRSLRDICNLTMSPGLTGRVAPLAMATLSEIESGKALPQLHTLHALAVVYKVSVSQLMAYVLEERLASQRDDFEGDRSALVEQFSAKLAAFEWADALQLAMHLERTAPTEASRVAWRGNRASCLMRLGLSQEALTLLTNCCESTAPSARQRVHILQSLATCHADAGDLAIADIMAREARALAESAGMTAAEAAPLDFFRVETVILRHEAGHEISERVLREHVRLVEGLITRWDVGDVCNRHRLALHRCRLLLALGNTLLAERDAQAALGAARVAGNTHVTAMALETLALVRVVQNKTEAAADLLEEARVLCEASGAHDVLFDINFRLYLLLRDERPGTATASFRRCEELFPLVSSRTPLARQFEDHARSRG